LLDEARDIPDEFYAAFAPSAIGASGKVVIASTAGPPRGFFYEVVQHPSEETWLHHATTNDNPHADRRMMNFLQRRLSVIIPAAARRELANEFTDDGSEFLPAALIEAAVDPALGEIWESEAPAFVMYDLSRKRDLTSRTVVLVQPPQQPEARTLWLSPASGCGIRARARPVKWISRTCAQTWKCCHGDFAICVRY
jgi:hypothetical protein